MSIREIRGAYTHWAYYAKIRAPQERIIALMRFLDYINCLDPSAPVSLCRVVDKLEKESPMIGVSKGETFMGLIEGNVVTCYRFDYPERELPLLGNILRTYVTIFYTPDTQIN